MWSEVVLALVASLFTATASVLQRLAAAPAPGELRFSWRLVAFLLHRPLWFLGILSMILGFLCQLAALRFGDLSLVEPIVASELLFVFAFLALRHRGGVRSRDWLAAIGMAGALGGFLFLADPRGGSPTGVSASTWLEAGAACGAAATLLVALSVVRVGGGDAPSPGRKAALLGAAAGIGWGFVAAVIKELSSHLGAGPSAVLLTWSPYVVLLAGAVVMFLASNAFQAGPLAASQPGLTIFDPLVATLLGLTMFGEHVHDGRAHLFGEAILAAVLCASVVLLSRSPLVAGRRRHPVQRSADGPPTDGTRAGEPSGGRRLAGTGPGSGASRVAPGYGTGTGRPWSAACDGAVTPGGRL